MMFRRPKKGPLDLSSLDQVKNVEAISVVDMSTEVKTPVVPQIPKVSILLECLKWARVWSRYIKRDIAQSMVGVRGVAVDIIGVTGTLPQTQKVLFAAGMIVMFVTVSLMRGVVVAQRFQQDVETLSTEVQQAQLPLLAGHIGQGDLREVITQVEGMRLELQRIKGELPQLITSSTNIGSTNAKVLQLIDIYDQLAVSSMAMLRTGDSLQEFTVDMVTLSPDDLRAKYKSITTYLSYQWESLMSEVTPGLRLSLKQLETIDSRFLPAHIKENVDVVTTYIRELLVIIDQVEASKDALLTLLGDDGPRHYVVLLENTGEARATGGFFGTMLFIKINSGYIEDLHIEDTYHIDGQILQTLDVPTGLADFQHELRLRDSNYWPDFPTSAKQISWFLDKYNGPSIDGIFAVTDRFATEALGYVGTLPIAGHDVPAKDALTVLSALIEAKVDAKDPKSYLKEITSELSDLFFHTIQSNPAGLLQLLDGIATKQVMGFSFDTKVQQLFDTYSFSGRVSSPSDGDSFLYVPTSVSGNKSDHYVTRYLTHHTERVEGMLTDTVSLTKQHLWSADTAIYLKNLLGIYDIKVTDDLLTILGAGENKEYVRYYVPKGSKLTKAVGVAIEDIDVSEELGFTVFGFTSNVLAGQRVKTTLTYRLPQDLGATYKLSLIHSPGNGAIAMQKSMSLGEGGQIHVKNLIYDRDVTLVSSD